MPTGTDWYEHLKRLPAARVTRMRTALKVLMSDAMFKEHFGELHRVDYFLEKVQTERRKK